MNLNGIAFLVGYGLQLLALMLVAPTFVALLYNDSPNLFFLPALSIFALGRMLLYQPFQQKRSIFRKEAIAATGLLWIAACSIGAIPFLLSNSLSLSDALFESISGWTTTGFSIIKHPQNLPPSLLWWRSQTQWMGGIGIIVTLLALLPTVGAPAKVLFDAEVSGGYREGFAPQIKQNVFSIIGVYTALTLCQITLLTLFSTVNLFEAILITFSTVSTGGFTPQSGSISLYHDPFLEWIVLLFMLLGATHFPLILALARRPWRTIDTLELRVFLSCITGIALLIFCNIHWPHQRLDGTIDANTNYYNALSSLFHVVSLQTSSGFVLHDYDLWSPFAQLLLLFSTFLGGMTGSTAGGIKIFRFIVLYYAFQRQLNFWIYPKRIHTLKLQDRQLDNNSIVAILLYILMILMTIALGTVAYTYCDMTIKSALALSACMTHNIGASFALYGPTGSSSLSITAKGISCLLMLFGRLEGYTFLLFFYPKLWRQQ